MQRFVALKDALWGIKKDDIITYDSPYPSAHKVAKKGDGSVLPGLDPNTEKTFFKEILEVKGKFSLGAIVMLVKVVEGQQVYDTYPYHDYMRSKKDIPAWTELRIIAYRFIVRKNWVVVSFNGTLYRVPESDLTLYDVYYFLNTKGEVHPANVGRDAKADMWRRGTNNYFNTKDEAQQYLDKVISDKIGVLNWDAVQ